MSRHTDYGRIRSALHRSQLPNKPSYHLVSHNDLPLPDDAVSYQSRVLYPFPDTGKDYDYKDESVRPQCSYHKVYPVDHATHQYDQHRMYGN